MKNLRTTLAGLLIIYGLIALSGSGFIHAQVATAQAQSVSGNATLPDGQPDSVVQITAEAQGLSLASPDQIPRFGTFWVISGAQPPAPLPFLQTEHDPASTPIFSLGFEGQFLVDATGGAVPQPTARQVQRGINSATLLQVEGNMVLDLISQVQEAQANAAMHTLARAMGLEMDSQDFAGSSYTFDTNGLWLEITNVANGLAYLNLHHGTDYVYEVWSKQDLLASNWDNETEVFPGTNQDVMPFTVSESGRTNLFIWARDWTGITSGGNETPEWWFWKYFHTVDLSDTDPDGFGVSTLLEDYQNGIDPNPILFSLQFPNEVNTNIVNGMVTIFGGTPFYMAVLVNNTNQADASWQPYAGTNITVSLNAGDGVYSVRVGLRGFPSDAQQTWLAAQLTLFHTVAPTFVITNPISSTVSTPMIQLQGFVSKALNTLTYDVSNAVGVVTNQEGSWNPAFFDTNVLDFTTNVFQCYDIRLTNGLNTITLHATDAVGNSTTTNISFTLDYSDDTTPPALSILWPPDGTCISGSNVTIQAQLDDATATIVASMNGDTNIVQGLVERSGLAWVNNLPLADGTNTVSLTATDAAGNATTTNLTLIKSVVTVTMDPISDDQLNRSLVNVTGTVSDSNVNVTVNGISATVNGDGTWNASDVPVSPTGMASFDLELSDLSNNPLGSQTLNQAQSPVISLMSYTRHYHSDLTWYYGCLDGPRPGTTDETVDWLYQSGGVDRTIYAGLNGDCQPVSSSPPTILAGGYNGYSPAWEIKNVAQNFYYPPYWYYVYDPQKPPARYYQKQYGLGSSSEDAHARVMIVPSGPAVPGQSALYLVSAQVLDEDSSLQVPGNLLEVRGTTMTDVTNDDGSVWSLALVSAPEGATPEVTPKRPLQKISFNRMLVTKVTLQILDANTGTNLSAQTNKVIVGQQMNLTCQLNVTNALLNNGLLTNFQWIVPGITFSDYVATASSAILYTNFPIINSNVIFYWANNGLMRVQCSATVDGKPVTEQAWFQVIRPEVTWILTPKDSVAVDTNYNEPEQTYAGLYHLRTGKGFTTNDVGMYFSFQVTDLKGYTNDYDIQFYQIVTIDWKENLEQDGISLGSYINGTGYDVQFPITWTSYSKTNGYRTDSPAHALTSIITFLWRRDSFEDFLMFTPAGGKAVPLKLATWNWYGRAQRDNTNSPPLFHGVMPFTNQQAAVGVDCFSHPEWTNNVINIRSQWQYHATYPIP